MQLVTPWKCETSSNQINYPSQKVDVYSHLINFTLFQTFRTGTHEYTDT